MYQETFNVVRRKCSKRKDGEAGMTGHLAGQPGTWLLPDGL